MMSSTVSLRRQRRLIMLRVPALNASNARAATQVLRVAVTQRTASLSGQIKSEDRNPYYRCTQNRGILVLLFVPLVIQNATVKNDRACARQRWSQASRGCRLFEADFRSSGRRYPAQIRHRRRLTFFFPDRSFEVGSKLNRPRALPYNSGFVERRKTGESELCLRHRIDASQATQFGIPNAIPHC